MDRSQRPSPTPVPPEALRVDLSVMRRRVEDQRTVDSPLPVAWLRSVVADTDAEIPGPGRLTVTISLQPDGIVLAQGRLEATMTVPCGRCLEPAVVDGTTDLVATFLPAAAAAERASQTTSAGDGEDDEDGIALDEGDLDTWAYEGTSLSLASWVAEHLKLAYPMRALCDRGEGCRGLCSNCGAPLNELPASARECMACHGAVPATPVADLPQASPEPAEPERVGSLAAALKKAGLDSSS